jgi:hypothetical protein
MCERTARSAMDLRHATQAVCILDPWIVRPM